MDEKMVLPLLVGAGLLVLWFSFRVIKTLFKILLFIIAALLIGAFIYIQTAG